MISTMNISDYLTHTASSSPLPGGGCAAALSAATAASLIEMVAELSAGKKIPEDLREEMSAIAGKASFLGDTLKSSIDKDAEAYKGVMEALKLAKDTDEQKANRNRQLEINLKAAAQVPLEVAYGGLILLELCEVLVQKGNQKAVTDVAVAAMMARTAVLGAAYNVEVNILSMNDIDFIEQTKHELDSIRNQATEDEHKIIKMISL